MGLPVSPSACNSLLLVYGVFENTNWEYAASTFSSGSSMMESEPLNRPPMYSSTSLLASELPPSCCALCFFSGLGPLGFGLELNPFPFVTNIFWPTVFTDVGYQPVGINPF